MIAIVAASSFVVGFCLALGCASVLAWCWKDDA